MPERSEGRPAGPWHYHVRVERTTTLPAAPTSARAARRFVAEALAHWRLPEVVETAELLVSELVTNALLHAHTDVELIARLTEGRVHIEVRDESSFLPTTRRHHQESQTGRGLELVETLADAWGVDAPDGSEGKGVWFELAAVELTTTAQRLAHHAHPSGRAARSLSVCLQGVPTALYRASEEHRQGLIRELVLMTIEDAGPDEVPTRLVALNEELSQRFLSESAAARQQVQAAEQRGDATLNLLLELTPDASAPLLAIVELLEQADRFCQTGAMLTVAATAEIRAFRRWCVDEIVGQLAHRPATPWRSR